MLIIRNIQHTNQGYYECQGIIDEYFDESLERVTFAARTTLTVRKYGHKIQCYLKPNINCFCA